MALLRDINPLSLRSKIAATKKTAHSERFFLCSVWAEIAADS